MKLRIVPYSLASESARLIADKLTAALNYKVWIGKVKPGRINLAWGGPNNGITGPQNTQAISRAVNKLRAFEAFRQAGVNIPEYSTRKADAVWPTVVARSILSGSEGEGITIHNQGTPLPDVPLYVQYVKKKKEFRVHVFNGEVIDVQEKRKRNGVDAHQVRNTENGYVFCHENIVEPTDLREQGVKAVQALGLLFGAVDIIWNKKQDKCYVLEVNTSPGLTPSTADKYTTAIVNYVRNHV